MDAKPRHSTMELEWVAALTAGGLGGSGGDMFPFIVNNKLIKWLKCF